MGSALSIIFIVSAHVALGNTGDTSGVLLEDIATPYYVFIDAGYQVGFITIPGGPVPIDPKSKGEDGKRPASVERFLQDEKAMARMQKSRQVNRIPGSDYELFFIPDSRGAMWDLASSDALGKLLTEEWANNAIIASVGHGSAGLVNAKERDGKPLVAGKKVGGISDSEEAAMKSSPAAPFSLEAKLRELGADYQNGPDFQEFVVQDGRLVTGQNPSSSAKVAELAIEMHKAPKR